MWNRVWTSVLACVVVGLAGCETPVGDARDGATEPQKETAVLTWQASVEQESRLAAAAGEVGKTVEIIADTDISSASPEVKAAFEGIAGHMVTLVGHISDSEFYRTVVERGAVAAVKDAGPPAVTPTLGSPPRPDDDDAKIALRNAQAQAAEKATEDAANNDLTYKEVFTELQKQVTTSVHDAMVDINTISTLTGGGGVAGLAISGLLILLQRMKAKQQRENSDWEFAQAVSSIDIAREREAEKKIMELPPEQRAVLGLRPGEESQFMIVDKTKVAAMHENAGLTQKIAEATAPVDKATGNV